MRSVFIKYLVQRAEVDKSIYLIVGDYGFGAVEPFALRFPKRFINIGIAEQNMIGVAAGMCMAGKNVFVYTMVPFLTMRAFEQIRIDICYQKLNVKLVGVHGGYSQAKLGTTHHAIEDVSIMNSLPEMTIISPGCKAEAEHLMDQFIDYKKGPAYMRLSNTDETFSYNDYLKKVPKIGKITEITKFTYNIIILTTSNSLDLGYKVCMALRKGNIDCTLSSVSTIKPFDKKYLLEKKDKVNAIFTIEEHTIIGGLGQIVGHFLSENFSKKIIFKSFAINDFYSEVSADRHQLLANAGLTVGNICEKIDKMMSTNSL